jgi:hypothetical protein
VIVVGAGYQRGALEKEEQQLGLGCWGGVSGYFSGGLGARKHVPWRLAG